MHLMVDLQVVDDIRVRNKGSECKQLDGEMHNYAV